VHRAVARDGDVMVVGTDSGLQLLVHDASYYGATRVASLPLPSPVRALAAADGMAYLALESGRVLLIDIREPRLPLAVADLALDARALAVDGGFLVASTAAGLELFPLPHGGSSSTAQLAAAQQGDLAYGLAPFSRGVLAAAGSAGVARIDLTTPSAPATATAWAVAAARQVERTGRSLYFLDQATVKVVTESVTAGAAPTFSAATSLISLQSVTRFAVSPDRIWTVGAGALRTAALPGAATAVSLTLGGSVLDVAGDERRAVAALDAAGMALVELDPSGSLVERGRFGAGARAVAMMDDLAVAAGQGSTPGHSASQAPM